MDNNRREKLLEQATQPNHTPFDYIIVGSGAGGGPLAARLAINGRRVLLIEAGIDITEQAREVYSVPAFHAAATEEPEITWDFSVRHYGNHEQQQRDSKYEPLKDEPAGTGGIQYPRAAAVGGCTTHYAMIIIRPNDADWDAIADATDDDSWRSQHMQGYFAKIENCRYYSVYRGFAGKLLGGLLKGVQFIATQLNPRRQLDPGGHGFKGWQNTSFIDPLVIMGIARGDCTFLSVITDVLRTFIARQRDRSMIGRAIARLQILQFLDPNVRSPEIPTRDHLSLISIGTDGTRRNGLPDYLKSVAKQYPEHLVIENPAHASRVIFAKDGPRACPRAIGVEVQLGAHLYRASLAHVENQGPSPEVKQFFARSEVILCGGAFNTPQLLMLSGIGDKQKLDALNVMGPRDKDNVPISNIIDLPGVGKNLQDRYEVSVISEAKKPFTTLDGVTFEPDQPNDPARKAWIHTGKGLYSTNGGALAFMLSSAANTGKRSDPDLFVFGVPAAFRGYYWGWSKELLRKTKGATHESRNLWSWVILKAYTDNNRGEVSLRSNDPLDVPSINFHSFDDDTSTYSGTEDDIDALCEAVAMVREINENVRAFDSEVQPGATIPSNSPALKQWVKDEAWGHHACGTCRMGRAPHCSDTADLASHGDDKAVVDSQFRVHGVAHLRIVDTSVFARIPGYFIVTPTFMISEKAADLLLADREDYPHALQRLEAQAIAARRNILRMKDSNGEEPASQTTTLPTDTIGLALSGGGIRSATFNLGVLQALAHCARLRDIDIISSVSGGGYIAGFLGRLYTRQADNSSSPDAATANADRVEAILKNQRSAEMSWLRQHAQYLEGAGRKSTLFDIGIILRNLVSVYLWLGTLLFGLFGLLHWSAISFIEPTFPAIKFDETISIWWWLPIALLLLSVLPTGMGYWLVTREPPGLPRDGLPFLSWLILVGGAIYGLQFPPIRSWCGIALLVLMLALLIQRLAAWKIPGKGQPAKWAQRPEQDDQDPRDAGFIVRNRLTHLLSISLFGFAATLLWAVLDSAARYLAAKHAGLEWSIFAMIPLLSMLQGIVQLLPKSSALGTTISQFKDLLISTCANLVALLLVLALLVYLDMLVYLVFKQDTAVGVWSVILALSVSAAWGQTFGYLNLSSLQQAYAHKLIRTFLGATNDARVHPTGTQAPVPVDVSDLGDDIDFDSYHPEQFGGPLHLVGTCVNNTVDTLSGNMLRDDQGMAMCVGPAGISVGRRFHALWEARNRNTPPRKAPVAAIRVTPDPNQFHVLARSDDRAVQVERLRLGQWLAISGAAFTTGTGRNTRLWHSLLFGLVNLRIGYWWDSDIPAGNRPSRYPPGLWRNIKSFPSRLFALQASLFNEWRGYFNGPAERMWYLSDGGHFDNTGLYELIRRRLPIMIAVDATGDPGYILDDLAILTRQVRVDFDATITWLQPSGWLTKGLPSEVPDWIRDAVNPGAIAAIEDLKRDGERAVSLARVTYGEQEGSADSWLLLIKPSLIAQLPTDLRTYAAQQEAFPQQSTVDQFFDDNQWEAYRLLGQLSGLGIFKQNKTR